MKSNVTEECLIIAIVLKILDEKRSCDNANIGKGKMWLLPPPVMMMEGVEEEQRSAGHKTKSVNCLHLMGQLTQPTFGDREKSNFNK